MKIDHRDFMASQAFYGLMIAHQPILMRAYQTRMEPVPEVTAEKLIDDLVVLSYQVADKQLAHSKKTKPKNRKQKPKC